MIVALRLRLRAYTRLFQQVWISIPNKLDGRTALLLTVQYLGPLDVPLGVEENLHELAEPRTVVIPRRARISYIQQYIRILLDTITHTTTYRMTREWATPPEAAFQPALGR